MKLGIVASEFFDLSIGRMGGFGWAARQVARLFGSRPDLNVEVVFLGIGLKTPRNLLQTRIHGTPIIVHRTNAQSRTLIEGHHIDLLLTIDYRPRYRQILEAIPEIPVVIWARDPRPLNVQAMIDTLRIPGAEARRPQGIKAIDCTSLKQLVGSNISHLSRFLFTAPTAALFSMAQSAFELPDKKYSILPNIVDLDVPKIQKHARPRVVFLGRLDPCKRPWLAIELARHFPEVEFVFMGQSHFEGIGAWRPTRVPDNVRFVGHVDGRVKWEILVSAWVLVNTSIHEGLATSFLESLACETPLLSCTNCDDVVSRFGVFTGQFEGAGLLGLPRFIDGLGRLLNNPDLRARLGREGREWVQENHSAQAFLAAFKHLCLAAGVREPACVC